MNFKNPDIHEEYVDCPECGSVYMRITHATPTMEMVLNPCCKQCLKAIKIIEKREEKIRRTAWIKKRDKVLAGVK